MRLLAKCNDEFSKVVNNNRIFKGYETSNFKKVVKFHMHISPVSFIGSLYLFYFKFKWQPANVSLSTVYISYQKFTSFCFTDISERLA